MIHTLEGWYILIDNKSLIGLPIYILASIKFPWGFGVFYDLALFMVDYTLRLNQSFYKAQNTNLVTPQVT